MTKKNNGRWVSYFALSVALVLILLLFPRITSEYSMMVLNIAIIGYITALNVSILLGMGGQLSFSGTAFMGLGAYVTANLTTGRIFETYRMDTIPSLLLSVLICGLAAYLIGLALFRLQGAYFTFASIGLVQVSWSLYLNYKPLCGGADGIPGIPFIRIFGWTPANYEQWFYVLMAFAVLCGIIVERIRTTKLGRSLACIRDNEIAAKTLGINVYKTKVTGFTIASMLAGLAGSLYAMHNQFVSADSFTYNMSTQYVIMAMLGGVNNSAGVFVGSLLVTMLPEWLRAVQQYLKLFYGLGIILLMIFMPEGLYGLMKILIKKLKSKKKAGKEVEKDESDTAPGQSK